MKGALLLLVAGALLSLVIFRGAEPVQMFAALETQQVIRRWDVDTALARLGDDLLVVDGRKGGRGARPKGALLVPFEERTDEHLLPEGRDVRAVLVVMQARRANDARELAQWLAREWAIDEVATLEGGFEAWEAAGLPVEGR
jgi:rhodanese-related sulfurtransferase